MEGLDNGLIMSLSGNQQDPNINMRERKKRTIEGARKLLTKL